MYQYVIVALIAFFIGVAVGLYIEWKMKWNHLKKVAFIELWNEDDIVTAKVIDKGEIEMRNLDIFKDNMKYFPKVILFGNIIHLTGILKKIVIGIPLNQAEHEELLEKSMTFTLITDLIGTKENQAELMEYANNYEVKKFGIESIEEFQEKWNEYGKDYFQIMNEASHGNPGKT